MAIDHTGKVAVISGGASGIGQACALRLAEDGADVAVADINSMAETVRLIEATGRRALAVECDVTDPSQVSAFGEKVLGQFGRCDILFNNAGKYAFIPIEELSYEAWRSFMALNVDAAFLMAKTFIPDMKARGWGRIINISSNSFSLYVPNMAHYVATKGAIVGLTRGLASDLGDHGITVNAVAPGPTITDKVRSSFFEMSGASEEAAFQDFVASISTNQAIKRAAQTSDVSGVVSFLASDDARFLTAQTIMLDGGGARL